MSTTLGEIVLMDVLEQVRVVVNHSWGDCLYGRPGDGDGEYHMTHKDFGVLYKHMR